MRHFLLIIPTTILLGACGGGGGGGSAVVPDIAFTSQSAIPKPSTVNFSGISVEGGYAAIGLTNTATSVDTSRNATATLKKTYDSSGNITALNVTGTNSTITANKTSNGVSNFGAGIEALATENSTGIVITTGSGAGLEYQTLGVWQTGISTNTVKTGALSAGNMTPASAIPTSGNATFTGFALGSATDAAGQNYVTASNVSVNADFANRNLVYNSTATQKTSTYTGLTSSGSELNLTGTLSYSAGTNSFNGNLTSQSPGYTGTATGRFYGPTAQEVGGTFNMKGTGLQTFTGAFGAKR